ncbi:unnamed protein product [Mytilus coruscus]|uniref:Uncharacterized protein n=1 Tax=Mytilus coruscus TaxID=42192 RepID=A0A6J8D2K4_MYTCO|nr:unnamed protein product [Mytilus coruscus]
MCPSDRLVVCGVQDMFIRQISVVCCSRYVHQTDMFIRQIRQIIVLYFRCTVKYGLQTSLRTAENVMQDFMSKQICNEEHDTVPQSNLNLNGDGIKLDNIEETGSGSDDSFVVLPQNVSVINGELIAPENETEGSGEVILDIPTSNQIVLEGKPPPPHNVSDEDLIPVSVNPTTISKSTTEKPPTFKNVTEPSTTTTVKSTTNVPVITSTTLKPTTEKEKELLDFGVGLQITEDKGDETNKEDNEENIYVPVQLDQPTTNPKDKTPSRSAISERKSAMTDDSDKVSIGIVIAVAIIAAIVFFVIGFIASKYCRRRRQSMKMMTKAQNNGGPHNGSIPIMADATNTYRSNGIYDEIGKEANGTCSSERLDVITPHAVDNVYAIPDKRRKQVQDIKFIDETTDDESKEGDKLLGTNETEDDKEDVTTPSKNGDISVSDTPAITTNETSPMLSEIQLEIENNIEPPKETDALVENS